MQQVADWLEKLGLGQYFAENDISFVVLEAGGEISFHFFSGHLWLQQC
jgi:hypothetical protein